jgi:hypothetical protein
MSSAGPGGSKNYSDKFVKLLDVLWFQSLHVKKLSVFVVFY